jgi:hypothetical protein
MIIIYPEWETLLKIKNIIIVNWFVLPSLGIWLWIRRGILSALFFVLIWLITDQLWDWLTAFLIMIVAKTVKDEDFYEMWKAGFLYRVPLRVALMMIMQVLGILVLPWVIVGFFLGWFM